VTGQVAAGDGDPDIKTEDVIVFCLVRLSQTMWGQEVPYVGTMSFPPSITHY